MWDLRHPGMPSARVIDPAASLVSPRLLHGATADAWVRCLVSESRLAPVTAGATPDARAPCNELMPANAGWAPGW